MLSIMEVNRFVGLEEHPPVKGGKIPLHLSPSKEKK